MKMTCLIISVFLCLAGCAAEPEAPDLEAAKASLLELDRAWSETVGNAEAFASYFAPDGRLMAPEDELLTGPKAIRAMAEQMFSTPGLSLTWEADTAEVSDDASLGYTTGSFRLSAPAAEEGGSAVDRTGNYATIWRKQQDGFWKIVVDIPTFDAPLPEPE